MKFWDQVLATLMGSVIGFIFAIVLFYLTEYQKKKGIKKNVIKCLTREFQYNLSLLQEWADMVDRILRNITASNFDVYDFLPYSRYQRFYFIQAFQYGLGYDYFDNDDMAKISKLDNHLNSNIENWLNNELRKWKAKEITNADALNMVEFQRTQLLEEKKLLEKLLPKLK